MLFSINDFFVDRSIKCIKEQDSRIKRTVERIGGGDVPSRRDVIWCGGVRRHNDIVNDVDAMVHH